MSYYKIINGKTYGPYNYSPRNRHEWTAKDLARIARYLKDKQGISAVEILVMIATAVGFGTLFCKTAKALTAALSLSAFIKQLGTVLALSTFIKVLIEFLLAAKLVSPKWLSLLMALLIATLMFVNKLFDSLSESLSNIDTINEVSKTIYELCDKANELAGVIKEETCEAISENACYAMQKKANELADSLKPEIEQASNILNMSNIERFWLIVQDRLHDGEWDNWTN
jgi:hypothetical protein